MGALHILATPGDKINELLLEHSSKWEVRVGVDQAVTGASAPGISHTR